jgi:hypothetical protein
MQEQPPLPDTVIENSGNSGLDAGPAAAFGAVSSPGATTHRGPVKLREPPGEAEGTPTPPSPPIRLLQARPAAICCTVRSPGAAWAPS